MDDAFREKARHIKMMLFDVDGVLTDGTFVPHVGPGGDEPKRFHARDGIGFVLARKAGLKLGLISGRTSSNVEARAKELKLDFVRLGVGDKRTSLEEALAQESLTAAEVSFMGDDLPDLPVLQAVGLSATVSDAPLIVRSRVDYVCRARGGYGAVRELTELVLASQEKLDALVDEYLKS